MNKNRIIRAAAGVLTAAGISAMLTGCGVFGKLTGSRPWEGTWYEQCRNGDTLEITRRKISCTREEYTFETGYKTRKNGGKTELLFEDSFVFEDGVYDPEEDSLLLYTALVLDGDGGDSESRFLRTPYEEPPAPVYGERKEQTDPDAVKEIPGEGLTSLSLSLYEPERDSGSAAPVPPVAGEYAYSLTVTEEKGEKQAVLSSDFCRDVRLSEESLRQLEAMLYESGIAESNGLDVWTEDMPASEGYVELQAEYASGEKLSLRANGEDIPASWQAAARQIHALLFTAFTDAGYNEATEEFHSTEPMLRLYETEESAADYTMTAEAVRTEEEGKTYAFTLSTEYPVFHGEGNISGELLQALEQLSEKYKALSLAELEKDREVMEGAPEAARREADRWYAYSFYTAEQISCGSRILSLMINEGHSNSLGLGEHGCGEYQYWWYLLDARTGRSLAAADLFRDPDKLADTLIEKACAVCGAGEEQERLRSGAYRQLLSEALALPGPEGGVTVRLFYDKVTLAVPRGEALTDPDASARILELYYDEVQEELSETYAVRN